MSLRARDRGLFPLPPLQVPPPAASLRSQNARQRQQKERFVHKLTTDAIVSLNKLHSSLHGHESHLQSPGNPTFSSSISAAPTAAQSRAHAHILGCVRNYVDLLGSSSNLSLAASLADDGCSPQNTTDPYVFAYNDMTQAVPLVADKVSLPEEGPRISLVSSLPPPLDFDWSFPHQRFFRPFEEVRPAPYAFLISPTEYIKLLRLMYSKNMLVFKLKVIVVNGMFGLIKPDGTIRLIIDCRPLNALMAEPDQVELPSPEFISELEAEPGLTLFTAKDDLKDFYHMFFLEPWLHEYMGLPTVRAGDISDELACEFGADTQVHPCVTTVPMGWSHACAVTQEAHINVAHRSPLLKRENLLTKTSDRKLDRPRHWIYIDDFGGIHFDKRLLAAIKKSYRYTMEAAGHTVKMSKSVEPTCNGMVSIGVFIHGIKHTVGVHPLQLHQLVEKTRSLLAQQKSTGKQISKVMGKWSWACLVRRAVFSVFNAVYRFIETAGPRTFNLWDSMVSEFSVVIGLAPLLVASLDDNWFPKALATDASRSGQGVTAAPMDRRTCAWFAKKQPPTLVSEVLRHPSEYPGLSDMHWEVWLASPFVFEEHINTLEVRALLNGVKAVCTYPEAKGCRLLVFCDSLVVTFAVRKGRSSKHPLLKLLRKVAAHQLALGIKIAIVWVPSELNPADEPSRRFESNPPAKRLFGAEYSSDSEGDGPPRTYSDIYKKNRSRSIRTSHSAGVPRPSRCKFLTEASVVKRTLANYKSSLAFFLQWLEDEGYPHISALKGLDRALARFCHDIYSSNDGAGRQTASNALAAIHLVHPESKGRLNRTYRALKGWRNLKPSIAHPPLTWPVTCLIAATLKIQGHRAMAVATLLGFDCYLRVSEFSGLMKVDVAEPGDRRMGSISSQDQEMVIRLKDTKTGPNQMVVVRRPVVKKLVKRMVQAPGGPKLFNFTSGQYRVAFKKACKSLGLSSSFVPHSLRHGGATHDFLNGVGLDAILLRGRWATTTSARRYIQSGRSLLIDSSISTALLDLAYAVQRRIKFL